MIFSWNWIKSYLNKQDIDFDDTIKKLASKGFEVEKKFDSNTDNLSLKIEIDPKIVVAKIKCIEKHPNADSLSLCDVECNNEIFKVVCGAKNIFSGAKVPFAQIGSKLPNGTKIEKSKIRDIVSFGMLCSKYELGLNDNDPKSHEGIWILDPSAILDTPIQNYLNNTEPKKDIFFNLTPPANRPDLHSVIGIAREISSLTDSISLKSHNFDSSKLTSKFSKKIIIENNQLCYRYLSCIIKNIEKKESASWIRDKLSNSNFQPIHYIIDLSNFLFLDVGYPTHVFDLDKIEGNTIRIRNAKEGEEFIGINQKTYTLNPNILCVADEKKVIALAGIIGGDNTKVDSFTKNILLEVPYFPPEVIYKTLKTLYTSEKKLETEAAKILLRGVNIDDAPLVLEKFLDYLKKDNVNCEFSEINDQYVNVKSSHDIPFSLEKLNQYLNLSLDGDLVRGILEKGRHTILNMGKNPNEWIVRVSPTRKDLEIDLDLFEEILKIYGYDHIKSEFRKVEMQDKNNPLIDSNPFLSLEVKEFFSLLFFQEAYNYSFMPKEIYTKIQSTLEGIGYPKLWEEDWISIQNTTNPDQRYLRNSLVYSLIESLNTNIYSEHKIIRLFEIGKVFFKDPVDDKVREKEVIGGIIYGKTQNLFKLSRILAQFLSYFFKEDPSSIHDPNYYGEYSLLSRVKIIFDRQNIILYKDKDKDCPLIIGYLGELRKFFNAEFKWSFSPIIFELDFDILKEIREKILKEYPSYKEVNPNPPIIRELTVDVYSITANQIGIVKKIKEASTLVTEVTLISVYKYSESPISGFLLHFKKSDQSLTLEKVYAEIEKIKKDILKIIIDKEFELINIPEHLEEDQINQSKGNKSFSFLLHFKKLRKLITNKHIEKINKILKNNTLLEENQYIYATSIFNIESDFTVLQFKEALSIKELEKFLEDLYKKFRQHEKHDEEEFDLSKRIKFILPISKSLEDPKKSFRFLTHIAHAFVLYFDMPTIENHTLVKVESLYCKKTIENLEDFTYLTSVKKKKCFSFSLRFEKFKENLTLEEVDKEFFKIARNLKLVNANIRGLSNEHKEKI